jgi:transcriptional regulator with XRE-family HTH domain
MDETEFRALLSRNLKRFRSRLGLSQLDLSLNLGISPTFVSDIETGKKWVSPQTLIKLAKALKIEVYELFKPEETMSDEANALLVNFLDTVSASIKGAVEQSFEISLSNIRKHYLKSPEKKKSKKFS